jgi:hypothetical protein
MPKLNKDQFRLFHGTDENIEDKHISPTKQEGDEWDGNGPTQAFASSKLEDAASYGDKVYEVHPTGDEEYHGYGVYGSEDGFKIKRQLKPEVVDRYKRIVGPIREEQQDLDHRQFMGSLPTPHDYLHTGNGNVIHRHYDKDGTVTSTRLKMGECNCPKK